MKNHDSYIDLTQPHISTKSLVKMGMEQSGSKLAHEVISAMSQWNGDSKRKALEVSLRIGDLEWHIMDLMEPGSADDISMTGVALYRLYENKFVAEPCYDTFEKLGVMARESMRHGPEDTIPKFGAIWLEKLMEFYQIVDYGGRHAHLLWSETHAPRPIEELDLMRRYFIKIMTKFELDLDQKRLHGGLGIKGTASLMLDGLGRLYKRSGMWEHWEEWHVRKLDKLCELTDPTLKHEAREMLISINKYKLERLADKAGPKSSGTSKPAM